jgi:hypothetical protein
MYKKKMLKKKLEKEKKRRSKQVVRTGQAARSLQATARRIDFAQPPLETAIALNHHFELRLRCVISG